jgi:hypothetical protein
MTRELNGFDKMNRRQQMTSLADFLDDLFNHGKKPTTGFLLMAFDLNKPRPRCLSVSNTDPDDALIVVKDVIKNMEQSRAAARAEPTDPAS